MAARRDFLKKGTGNSQKWAKIIGGLCAFFKVKDKPFEIIAKLFLNIAGDDFV